LTHLHNYREKCDRNRAYVTLLNLRQIYDTENKVKTMQSTRYNSTASRRRVCGRLFDGVWSVNDLDFWSFDLKI